jgi:hypothetical protein
VSQYHALDGKMKELTFSSSRFQKDSRQAGMTITLGGEHSIISSLKTWIISVIRLRQKDNN